MRWAAGFAVGVLLLSNAASAAGTSGQHIVDPHDLMRGLESQSTRHQQDLADARGALAQPQVRQAARGLGIDLARVDAALDTLSDADLAAVADAARRTTHALVGGASTVTISTTTIIIGLLVLILIIVAVK
jgi:hypothetical protein